MHSLRVVWYTNRLPFFLGHLGISAYVNWAMPSPKARDRLGFFSRNTAIRNAKLDTPEGRAILRFRRELVDQFGGSDRIPPTKMAVIEAAAVLRFRLHAIATKFLRGEAEGAELDVHFVTVANSLTKHCVLLGLDPPPAVSLSLEDYVAKTFDPKKAA